MRNNVIILLPLVPLDFYPSVENKNTLKYEVKHRLEVTTDSVSLKKIGNNIFTELLFTFSNADFIYKMRV